MSYQVIARKWRPQDFSQLVGQSHIGQTLLNALRSDRIPHALLFTGPRGTGKTSTARILAKALKCQNAQNFVPCQTCKECEDIALGRSVDVHEIDGASNNGVEAIRELIDTIPYMPSSGKFKVYIIDEVHMLSTSAFNALLKTLEEPPAHVVFILATTDVHKVPLTILSRCQRFDFRRIPTRLIAERLKVITDSEGLKADEEALWLVARQADGSLRDSQSLLDQVITFSAGEITANKVIEILGLTSRSLLLDTLAALVEKSAEHTLKVLENIALAGYDPKTFTQDVLEQLRNLMLLKVTAAESLVDLPDSEIAALKTFGEKVSAEDVHLLFDMALKGAGEIARAQDPGLVLEMLLLKMSQAPKVEDLTKWLKNSSGPVLQSKSESVNLAKSPSTENSAGRWSDLVKKINSVNALVGAKLAQTFLLETNGKKLVIGIPEKMKILFDQMNDVNFRKKVTNYVNTFWGDNYDLEFRVVSQDGDSPTQLEERKRQAERANLEKQVAEHPLVKSAQRVFNGEIKSIKEQKT